MSKFHPLDVRYKGPSTAYRGSAHRKRFAVADAASAQVKPDRPVPSRTNTTATAPSPWGVKQAMRPAATPSKKIASQVDPLTVLIAPFAAVKKVVGVVGYLQLIIGLLIAIAFLK